MKYSTIAICLALVIAGPRVSRADDAVRFAPLAPDQLTQEQKAWADAIAAPPRNAKYTNPPYRAYIRSPDLAPRLTNLTDYLRWNTSLPARLSEFAILITARQWTAQYEWFAHYPLAMKAGLDPEVANDIAHGVRPGKMRILSYEALPRSLRPAAIFACCAVSSDRTGSPRQCPQNPLSASCAIPKPRA
jgi:4-carboxymuconolactone decarboxylase